MAESTPVVFTTTEVPTESQIFNLGASSTADSITASCQVVQGSLEDITDLFILYAVAGTIPSTDLSTNPNTSSKQVDEFDPNTLQATNTVTVDGLNSATVYEFQFMGLNRNTNRDYYSEVLTVTTLADSGEFVDQSQEQDDTVVTTRANVIDQDSVELGGAYSPNQVNGDELDFIGVILAEGIQTNTDLREVGGVEYIEPYSSPIAGLPISYNIRVNGQRNFQFYTYQAYGKLDGVYEVFGLPVVFEQRIPGTAQEDDEIITNPITPTETTFDLVGQWLPNTSAGDPLEQFFFYYAPVGGSPDIPEITDLREDPRAIQVFPDIQPTNSDISNEFRATLRNQNPQNYLYQAFGTRVNTPTYEKLGAVVAYTVPQEVVEDIQIVNLAATEIDNDSAITNATVQNISEDKTYNVTFFARVGTLESYNETDDVIDNVVYESESRTITLEPLSNSIESFTIPDILDDAELYAYRYIITECTEV